MLMIGLRVTTPGRDAEVVQLVRDALALARQRNLLTVLPARLMRGVAGEILLVAELASVSAVDAIDEDPDLQDIVGQLGMIAEAVPLQSFLELSATRVTFEILDD
jgi:hypothetical protein